MPKERGFLFASATLATELVLVLMMTLMAATAILLEMGTALIFTD